MLTSLIIISLITAGGLGVTYLIEKEEPMLWRVAAGNVIGSAIFGTVTFALAMMFGLTVTTVAASLVITLLPIGLIYKGERRKRFDHDLAKAKGRFQGSRSAKMLATGIRMLLLGISSSYFIDSSGGAWTWKRKSVGPAVPARCSRRSLRHSSRRRPAC